MNQDDEIQAAWDAYKEVNPPRGQAEFYYKDNAEYWKAGYIAASKQPQTKVAICTTKMYGKNNELIARLHLEGISAVEIVPEPSKQHTMPSYAEFTNLDAATRLTINQSNEIFEFFASRIKQVAWPSDEEVLEMCRKVDIHGKSALEAIAWLKARVNGH